MSGRVDCGTFLKGSDITLTYRINGHSGVCLLQGIVNSLMNVLEGECSWLRLLEIFINVNNVVSLLLLCILFTFILVVFAVVFLFTCLPFLYCWCLLLQFLFIILMLSDVKAKHQQLDFYFRKNSCIHTYFFNVQFLLKLTVITYDKYF